MTKLDRPRLYIDLNEMLEENLFLLSRDDQKVDSAGNTVALQEGMRVYIYMDDQDENRAPTNILATGVAERNRVDTGWSAGVRWCCRIDRWHE